MNIYRVDGIRHPAVAFGATPEEAVAQARASGEVGDWEAPDARRVPLPEGYALRPARQTVELLKAAMEEGWTALRPRLDGLTESTANPHYGVRVEGKLDLSQNGSTRYSSRSSQVRSRT